MIIVTIEHLPGYEITEVLGVVYGSTVRAKHLGSDIAAAFKNLAGGELKGYMDLLEHGSSSRKTRCRRNNRCKVLYIEYYAGSIRNIRHRNCGESEKERIIKGAFAPFIQSRVTSCPRLYENVCAEPLDQHQNRCFGLS